MWDFAVANPTMFAFLETHHHAAYLDDESLAIASAIDGAAIDFIAAGQRAGVFRDGDPTAVLALAFGSFIGLTRVNLAVESNRAMSAGAAWNLLADPSVD